MSAMNAARFIARRLSSSGRVLREEEKKAENVFNKGPKAAEKTPAKPVHSSTDVKPTNPHGSSSSEGTSTNLTSNYSLLLAPMLLYVAWVIISSKSRRNQNK
ncbi:uncharacterized protein LOC122030507 [Zingiber officinale]|uniref:uncharacterized protein LOC122028205 n=1 Tax=Zingiber officinale TaxID=94328 RepID=UPI001C4D56BF|nr:uncharacterized protein LOC122028205 [Zingiber officinale]XP_042445657.1 uncharacterized protein LOC122030507 [Zingiber officinale]